MRETVLYIGMTLDGYIADCDGGVGWMGGQDPTDESAGSYPEFLHTVDTVMMGRNTYHQIVTELSPEEWVYAGLRSYVITHRPQPDADGIIFTNESPGALVDRLKVQPGRDIWGRAGPSAAARRQNRPVPYRGAADPAGQRHTPVWQRRPENPADPDRHAGV